MVVLPHPDGPTRAVTRLRTRSRVTSRTTVCLPKATLTPRSDTAALVPDEDARLSSWRGLVPDEDPTGEVSSIVISVLRWAGPSYAVSWTRARAPCAQGFIELHRAWRVSRADTSRATMLSTSTRTRRTKAVPHAICCAAGNG